ncbi:MAG: family oxidoreductase [Frankiales bacterium]|nr:family oxidoreductase [Frankiales bacterium]
MGLLDGKVALVTGAAGGIGSDTSLALAEAGARVVLTDVAAERLEEVTTGLRDKGYDVASVVTDITDEAGVQALVQAAVERFGRIDVLDNNAGATGLASSDRDVVSMDLALWQRSYAINVTGPMLLAKHIVPLMVQNGGGSIINISSGQSLAGDLANTAYAAGKAALNSLTRDLATQYGPQGVRCNAVAPGLIVAEEHLAAFPEAFRDMFVDNCSVPRLGVPRDISNAVVFLASDLAGYITGQVLSVDGGITAHLPTVAPMRAMQAGWVTKKDTAS